MKLFCICFTKVGASLQKKLAQKLQSSPLHGRWADVQLKAYLSPRIYEDLKGENDLLSSSKSASLADFCEKAWTQGDGILFIGAAGIAIRGMSSYISRKDQDPALLVMDESGQFVIPLLSGHLGGANELSLMIQELLGAKAVITTATDVQQKLAIDSWAREKDYFVEPVSHIVKVSGAVLENKTMGLLGPKKNVLELQSLYPQWVVEVLPLHQQPKDGLLRFKRDYPFMPMVVISPWVVEDPMVLHLVPKEFVVGMGARKDKEPREIVEFFDRSLAEEGIHPKSVLALCSITLKAKEEGFHVLSKERELPFVCFEPRELLEAEQFTDHEFAPSKLVQSVTGVDNVCERAAVIGAIKRQTPSQGKMRVDLIRKKTKCNGMTLAIGLAKEEE